MAEEISPTVARRELRLALRDARDASTLTQQEVAEAMEWSLSKVIRIESGDVRISPNDLRPLLSLLNVKDRDRITELLALAKVARTRQRAAWYQVPTFKEHITENLAKLIEYEGEADEFRYHQVFFMPGVLQTWDYARAKLAFHEDDLTEETRTRRLEVRDRRRDNFLARLGVTKAYVLLDESVFSRPVGGPEVFREQVRFLYELAVAKRISVRMIPFSNYSAVTNNATFELLSLRAGDPSSDVLYRESGTQDEMFEGGPITVRHHQRFDKIWRVAATEDDTIEFMVRRMEELKALIGDRGNP